ncbi:hypothetical protein ACLKA7_017658, partial [Drosophila subpalustris]
MSRAEALMHVDFWCRNPLTPNIRLAHGGVVEKRNNITEISGRTPVESFVSKDSEEIWDSLVAYWWSVARDGCVVVDDVDAVVYGDGR